MIFAILFVLSGMATFFSIVTVSAKGHTEMCYREQQRFDDAQYAEQQLQLQTTNLINQDTNAKTIYVRPEQDARIVHKQIVGTQYDGEQKDWWV